MYTGEIIITKYNKQAEDWFLEKLVGEHNAESELKRLQNEFPNEKFRIERMSPEEAKNAWWNKDLD